MTFNELPQDKQQALIDSRKTLYVKMREDTGYRVVRVNKTGTRFFEAQRRQIAYTGNPCGYMRFGGGSYWVIYYGEIRWRAVRHPMGNDYDCVWICSHKHLFGSRNGVQIPGRLNTKKEVMALIDKLEIFNH